MGGEEAGSITRPVQIKLFSWLLFLLALRVLCSQALSVPWKKHLGVCTKLHPSAAQSGQLGD